MNITFQIDDQEFEAEQKELLKKTLKIEDPEIQNALNKIAKASLTEYLTMLVEGQGGIALC